LIRPDSKGRIAIQTPGYEELHIVGGKKTKTTLRKGEKREEGIH